MLAGFHKTAAKVQQRRAVQTQGFNGCPANACEAEDLCSAVRPGEMLAPHVSSRMKQGDLVAGYSLARQRQIARRPLTLSAARPNVLQREALKRKRGRAAAVFATPIAAHGRGPRVMRM